MLPTIQLRLARRALCNSALVGVHVSTAGRVSAVDRIYSDHPEHSTAAAAGVGSPPIGQSLLQKGNVAASAEVSARPRRAEGAFMHPLRGGCAHRARVAILQT